MMKTIVLHLSKIPRLSSTIASVRIANVLAGMLKCKIMSDKDPELSSQDYDAIFIVNSPSAFCTYIPELVSMCHRAKRVIWVMNDFDIHPPTQLGYSFYDANKRLELWGTLPKLPEKFSRLKSYRSLHQEADYVFNWNALTFDPMAQKTPSHEGIVYWGAYRDGRKEDFIRYLTTQAHPVTISTSVRSVPKWEEKTGVSQDRLVPPFVDLISEIRDWPATIYIEDEFSHQVFCQPANRFYEALSAHIAVFVDHNAVKTLNEAGFAVDPNWVVRKSADVAELLPRALNIMEDQQKQWVGNKDYQADLLQQLFTALTEEGFV